jgi:cytochrome oxidase assembly protein ShyY1
MRHQRGRAVFLVTALLASFALLAWSVLSTWQQSKNSSGTDSSAAVAEASSSLPPPLDSSAAKAKLFYPRMKARGPQPGSDLQSKPLMARMPSDKAISASEPK